MKVPSITHILMISKPMQFQTLYPIYLLTNAAVTEILCDIQ